MSWGERTVPTEPLLRSEVMLLANVTGQMALLLTTVEQHARSIISLCIPDPDSLRVDEKIDDE